MMGNNFNDCCDGWNLPSFLVLTVSGRLYYDSSTMWRLDRLQLDSDSWQQAAIDRK
jgi:hypothetical protein